VKGQKRIPVEVYSRVVGYFRPVNQWNKGKKEEFSERNEFDPKEIENAMLYEFQGTTQNIAC
jgi:ribonucleoside-triphosphate reductase